ncbi:MAG: transporter [Pseudomonas sp.]|nr:transporter [Pseudomonas sp.]
MSFLQLNGLVKNYGSFTVVNHLDLSVEKGKLVCLLGPSGCGKTTTLRLIAGFAKTDGGEIRVDGKTISSAKATVPPESRNMSMIFQSYALWPHMTVFQNVAYGLRLRRLPAKEVAARTRTILESTQLIALENRYPGELSGGQQQRVSLARALVIEPGILLLDEPLSNLDANLREEMRFEIRRLHDEFRYTTVYVTHDQVEAMTTADIIIVMNGGRIEQAGSPEDIYERPQTEFVARFIGGTNILKGAKGPNNTVMCEGGLALHCASGSFPDSGQTAVSIRHHDIQLFEKKPDCAATNWAAGIVDRHVYLGSHRDYHVTLRGGETVRAVVPSNIAISVGKEVWLYFAPESCRALAQ